MDPRGSILAVCLCKGNGQISQRAHERIEATVQTGVTCSTDEVNEVPGGLGLPCAACVDITDNSPQRLRHIVSLAAAKTGLVRPNPHEPNM